MSVGGARMEGMCGRYALAKDPASLAEEFDALDGVSGPGGSGTGESGSGSAWVGPEYNVAPTMTVAAVVDRHPRDDAGTPDPSTLQRSLRPMRWGLVPSWARDMSVGNKLINARAESLTEKPAFRRAAAGRRCLLPADGWFEWLREGTGKEARKIPYFMTLPSGASLALAGLWETWRPKDDSAADSPPLVSAAVVTVASAGPLSEIHHRMPLFLPAERWADWLDPDRADPTDLLVPPPTELLAEIEMRQVSSKVNNVRNHGPELVEEHRAEPEQAGLDLEGVGTGGSNPA
jgi:putative SOS response-associated peptidase YedK